MKLKKNLLIMIMINILLPQNFAATVFTTKLTQANSVAKTDFDGKLKILSHKNNSNKAKHLLVENESKKLQTFDSIYFTGKSHFEVHGTQIIKYFSQYTDIEKGLQVLVVVIIFIFGNLKDYVMKILQLLLLVIIASIHKSWC